MWSNEARDRRATATPGPRRLSRRAFLSGTLAAAGGAALSGCQTDIGSQGGSGEVVGGENAKVTLQQWYHQYGEKGTHEAVVRYAKEFNKANPDIAVEVGWNPGDYNGKLITSLLQGGPDVYEKGQPTIKMIQAGQVQPLDDLFTEEVKADFNPAVLKRQTVDGKIYGVPMVVDTGVIYYRKSMLAKAGVEPPKSVDEVIAAAKKLTQGKTKGLFLGNDGGIAAMLHVLPWSAGVTLLENKEITFNTPETVAAYEKLVELNATDSLLVGFTTDWFDPSAFNQGLCAMQWGGLWMMPLVQEKLGDDFDVVPWPALTSVPSGTPASFVGGWSEMVNGKTKHVEEAKKLVEWQWLENTEIQTDFNLSYGFHVPPRRSIAEKAEALKTGPAAKAVEVLEKYAQANSPYWNGSMDGHLTNALSKIVKEGADIEAQVRQAAEKCDAELQKELK